MEGFGTPCSVVRSSPFFSLLKPQFLFIFIYLYLYSVYIQSQKQARKTDTVQWCTRVMLDAPRISVFRPFNKLQTEVKLKEQCNLALEVIYAPLVSYTECLKMIFTNFMHGLKKKKKKSVRRCINSAVVQFTQNHNKFF